jgi:hypothetical protein
MVAGHEGEQLLLDKGDLPAVAVIDMELLAPGEDLTLHKVFFVALLIQDGKLVAKGENMLLDVQLHRKNLQK